VAGGLAVEELGRVPYAEALELQRQCVEARRRGAAPDTLFLLEHPPVITLGRSANAENLQLSRDELAARGIEVHEVARGGDVTYHAPGQLVGYAIVDLAARDARDVHAFLRGMEAALCDALGSLGVPPRVVPGMTGVFVESGPPGQASLRASAPSPLRKIASIGIGVRHWITLHGFALNVDLDLSGFEAIVPCGLHGVEMTSIAEELTEVPPDLARRARDEVAAAFTERLGR
jgi:lipoate-protein ligase B